jgi:hypothetical protein
MTGKDSEGSGRGLFEAVPRHLADGTEANYENLGRDNGCPDPDMNREHPP